MQVIQGGAGPQGSARIATGTSDQGARGTRRRWRRAARLGEDRNFLGFAMTNPQSARWRRAARLGEDRNSYLSRVSPQRRCGAGPQGSARIATGDGPDPGTRRAPVAPGRKARRGSQHCLRGCANELRRVAPARKVRRGSQLGGATAVGHVPARVAPGREDRNGVNNIQRAAQFTQVIQGGAGPQGSARIATPLSHLVWACGRAVAPGRKARRGSQPVRRPDLARHRQWRRAARLGEDRNDKLIVTTTEAVRGGAGPQGSARIATSVSGWASRTSGVAPGRKARRGSQPSSDRAQWAWAAGRGAGPQGSARIAT